MASTPSNHVSFSSASQASTPWAERLSDPALSQSKQCAARWGGLPDQCIAPEPWGALLGICADTFTPAHSPGGVRSDKTGRSGWEGSGAAAIPG